MSRSLRSTSSAQSSPSSKSSNFTESTYTPSVTPRKAPHCTQCKRPRAGHPRSGCPYVDSPKADQPPNSVASDVGIGLTDALGSMQIASAPVGLVREREEETKTTIRNRRRLSAQPQLPASDSLLSLSTNSSEIVARLLQPGMFDDTADGEDASGRKVIDKKIVRWQETLVIPTTPKAEPALKKNKGKGRYSTRSPMPCTLDTPETSFASSTNSVLKQAISAIPQVEAPVEEEEPHSESAGPSTATPTQGQDTPSRRVQPLVRSMSLEQREMFISKLTVKSPATIYILPKADIPTVTASATALGFHACAVLSDDAEDPEALLILGQDLAAVKKLFGKVEEENRKHAEQRKPDGKGKPRSSLGLKAAAGGAVVGAVGAWAGLAFA